MVNYHCLRNNGMVHDFGIQRKNILDALKSLIKFEFGFGGQITELSETKIVVETNVLGACVDTTIFSGPNEEMEWLFEAAVIWLHLQQQKISSVEIDRIMEMTKGNPLWIMMTAPLVVSEPRSKICLSILLSEGDAGELTRILKKNFTEEELYSLIDTKLIQKNTEEYKLLTN